MTERGSVLAYVLVLALVGSLLCSGIMQMRLQPAMTLSNTVDRVSNDLAESAALNRLTSVWARLGTCASSGIEEVACRRPPFQPVTPCRCTCVAAGARVESNDRGAACALTLAPR